MASPAKLQILLKELVPVVPASREEHVFQQQMATHANALCVLVWKLVLIARICQVSFIHLLVNCYLLWS